MLVLVLVLAVLLFSEFTSKIHSEKDSLTYWRRKADIIINLSCILYDMISICQTSK